MELEEIVRNSAAAYDTIEDEDRMSIMTPLYRTKDGWEADHEAFMIVGNTNTLQLMVAIAKLYSDLFDDPEKPHPEGLMLAVDGWGYPAEVNVQMGKLSDAEREELLSELGPPSQHPQRCSTAMIIAVTQDEVFCISQIKGDEPLTTDNGMTAGGRVIDGLRIIVSTYNGL